MAAAENLNPVKHINIIYASNSEDLARDIAEMLNCNDVVLVKGSRGMHMENIVEAIKVKQVTHTSD